MKYFQNLRLQNLKGIKSCELLNLSKINVICGKNNSGKSTILECIAKHDDRGKPTNRIGGFNINEQTIKYLNNQLFNILSRNGYNNTQTDSINKYFIDLIEISKGNIFWENDPSNFGVFVYNKYISRPGRIVGLSQQVIGDIFNALFSTKNRVQLILAKRNPSIRTSILTNVTFSYQGDWFINYLFNCKNSAMQSQKFDFFNKLKAEYVKISSGYTFDIVIEQDPKQQNIISLKFSNDNKIWRNAEDCGLGLQDLLVILSYALDENNDVLMIEEPENHIHPDMQRKLLNFLKNNTDKQYIFTTHSNVFLDNAYIDTVYYCSIKDDEVTVTDETSKAFILNELGYSIADNLVSDLIILTEGPSDKPVLEELLLKMCIIPKYNIKFWAMGGDIMDKQDLSVFVQNYKVMALIDKDPGSSTVRDKLTKKCNENNIPVTQLERYSIENYFTLDVLKKVFHSQISESVTAIDPNIKLENQIGIDVKKNNRKIAKEINLCDIEGTDLNEFLKMVKNKLEEKIILINSKNNKIK